MKNVSKFLGSLLVLTMLTVPLYALAQEAAFSGSGTEGDPYLITSEENLQNLSELINAANGEYVSAYYRLTDDLDFTSYGKLYQPIGTAANPFKGSFDGNGHVVSNISNEDQSETMREYGVFGALGENAVVRNLGVNKVTFKNNKAWTQNYMGGIAGKIVGDASIENCYTTGCVFNLYGNAQDCGSGGIAGGVLAEATLTVKNCYSTAIKGDYTKKSGIVYCTGSSGTSAGSAVLTNCYSVNADTSPDTTNCYLASDADCTAEHLGSSFETDIFGLNNGLPILSWQKNYKVNTLAAVQNGTLSASGAEGDVVVKDNLVYIKSGNSVTYTVSADPGYRLDFITYGGEDMSANFVTGSAIFAYDSLVDGAELSAGMALQEITPAIRVGGYKTGTFTDRETGMVFQTNVVYAIFTGPVAEYGVILEEKGNPQNKLKLKAEADSNGAYAVAVYGEAIIDGRTYIMTPYIIYEDETIQSENGEEFTVTENVE